MISLCDDVERLVLCEVRESKRMVSGFLGKELLRKELRVRISCSPLEFKSDANLAVPRLHLAVPRLSDAWLGLSDKTKLDSLLNGQRFDNSNRWLFSWLFFAAVVGANVR